MAVRRTSPRMQPGVTSPTGIASINGFGIATGVASGLTTISATFEAAPAGNSTAHREHCYTLEHRGDPDPNSACAGLVSHLPGGRSLQRRVDPDHLESCDLDLVRSAPSSASPQRHRDRQSAGTANITAKYQGVTSNAAGVLVTSSALASIAVTPSPATIPDGVSLPFTAIGTLRTGTTQNLTANVTWASSQPSVATISNALGQQGVATGSHPGQTSITAVFAGIVSSRHATLTVTNATISLDRCDSTNPATATVGTNVSFTAMGTFSDSKHRGLCRPR